LEGLEITHGVMVAASIVVVQDAKHGTLDHI
jgi:hypothetical protein